MWGDKADELAELGTISESTLGCPISQSYIKRLIDEKFTRLNQETWLTDGPRHTKLTLSRKHINIIKNNNTTLCNKRQNYKTAVHCSLNKHLHTSGVTSGVTISPILLPLCQRYIRQPTHHHYCQFRKRLIVPDELDQTGVT